MPGDQLRETREAISDAFDRAQPGGARANRGKESGQHCGGRFVAPVTEQAGEANAKHGAVEPGLLFCGVGHKEAVYSCQSTVDSFAKRKTRNELTQTFINLSRIAINANY